MRLLRVNLVAPKFDRDEASRSDPYPRRHRQRIGDLPAIAKSDYERSIGWMGVTIEKKVLALSGQRLSGIYGGIKTCSQYTRVASLVSNETIPPGLYSYRQSSTRDPQTSVNGYLVGVGMATALTGIQLFDSAPQGALFIETHPRPILLGRALGKSILSATSFADVVSDFNDAGRFSSLIAEVVAEEVCPHALRLFKPYAADPLSVGINNKYGNVADVIARRIPTVGDWDRGSANNQIGQALEKNFEWWKQLVTDGSFSVIFGDLTSPYLMKAISNLPQFRLSNNVVYLSNVEDVVVEADPSRINATADAIHFLTPESGFHNTYLSSLNGEDYVLSATHTPPRYVICSDRNETISGPHNVSNRGRVLRQWVVGECGTYGPVRSPRPGETYPIITLGSDYTNAIVLPGREIYPKHAKIAWDGSKTWEITILSKEAHCIVNDTKLSLDTNQIPLADHSLITLGRNSFRVSIQEAEGETFVNHNRYHRLVLTQENIPKTDT